MASSFFTSGLGSSEGDFSTGDYLQTQTETYDEYPLQCVYLKDFYHEFTSPEEHSASTFCLSHLMYANIGVLIFTVISGTIGNLLVFLSMVVEEKLVTCVNGLHGNLALSDALNCMIGASLHLVRFFLDPSSVAFNMITRAEHFILHYNFTASCLSIMALSFLKYWKLTHHLNKQPCKVIYVTMAMIQIIAILIGITGLFDAKGMLGTCTPGLLPVLEIPMWTIIYILIPLFVITLIVSALLKISAYLTLKKENDAFNTIIERMHVQQSASRYDFTGTRGAFFLMIGVQVVCNLPFVVFYIWCSLNSNRNEAFANTIVTCLLCSCAINPFLYTLRCHTYRRTLKKIFACKKDKQTNDDQLQGIGDERNIRVSVSAISMASR